MEALTVSTGGHKSKQIEIVGVDKTYQQRSAIQMSREITLELCKIHEIGVPGSLRELIPNTMYLYLDKNLLYSWD
jgi:hypothetical protein